MSTVRLTTVGFILLALGNIFSGCAAAMPRGAITSDRSCQDDFDCNAWEAPRCYSNIQQCYNRHCLMRRLSGCKE